MPNTPAPPRPEPSAAQWRVINAALDLFARNGVGGTSLRMIAAELGVTVAAVYHQFHTKDEIIAAAVDSELRRLESVVATAEAVTGHDAAQDALVEGMADLAVGESGRRVSAVLSDPIVASSLAQHGGFREVMDRMKRILGDDSGASADGGQIRTATLIAVLNGAALHPFVANYEPDVLREQLVLVAQRLLAAPER